mmetsp:Transcript_7056/g.21185  ORF Transcript_7056/g.21185 Transcript_7056/m.21185 type:complete len:467 (-) Transcript_7056:21-1421(-)
MDVLAGGAGGRAETLGRRCGGAGGERWREAARRSSAVSLSAVRLESDCSIDPSLRTSRVLSGPLAPPGYMRTRVVELVVAERVLRPAGGVDPAAGEDVQPLRFRVPVKVPRGPPKGARLAAHLCPLPRLCAVARKLDVVDVDGAGPDLAADAHHARRDQPRARVKVRVARRRHHCADGQLLDRQRRRVEPRAAVAVHVHLGPPPAARGDLDRGEPFDRGHAVPARHDDPHRRAVARQQVRAVHLPAEHNVARHRLLDRQRAAKVVDGVPLDALVRAREDDLRRTVFDADLLQQLRQRAARPVGAAKRVGAPRHVRGEALREAHPPVAGASHEDGGGLCLPPLDVGEGQAHLLVDEAVDLEPVCARVDERHVKVDEEVVRARWRDVGGQSLDMRAVAPLAELQLRRCHVGTPGRVLPVARLLLVEVVDGEGLGSDVFEHLFTVLDRSRSFCLGRGEELGALSVPGHG